MVFKFGKLEAYDFFRHNSVGQTKSYIVAEYLKVGGNRDALMEQGLICSLSFVLEVSVGFSLKSWTIPSGPSSSDSVIP